MITLQQLAMIVFALILIVWPIALGIYFQGKFRPSHKPDQDQTPQRNIIKPVTQQSPHAQHNPAQSAPDQLAA